MFCSRYFLIIFLLFTIASHTTLHAMESRPKILGLQETADLRYLERGRIACQLVQLHVVAENNKKQAAVRPAPTTTTNIPKEKADRTLTEQEQKAFGEEKEKWAREQELLYLRELQEEALRQVNTQKIICEDEIDNNFLDIHHPTVDARHIHRVGKKSKNSTYTPSTGIFGTLEQEELALFVFSNLSAVPSSEHIIKIINKLKSEDYDEKPHYIMTDTEKEAYFAPYAKKYFPSYPTKSIIKGFKIEFRHMTAAEEKLHVAQSKSHKETGFEDKEEELTDYEREEVIISDKPYAADSEEIIDNEAEAPYSWDSDEETCNDPIWDKELREIDPETGEPLSDEDDDDDYGRKRHKDKNSLAENSQRIDSAQQQSALSLCPQEVGPLANTWRRRYTNDEALKNLSIDEQEKRIQENLILRGAPKKWLISGPTGTGKTTICKALGSSCNIPFFIYKTPTILASYIKDVKVVETIINHALALRSPCIICLDDIEILNDENGDLWSDMLNNLLKKVDQHRHAPILFIATLNCKYDRKKTIKKLFGENVIDTDLPNNEQRQAVIAHYINQFYAGKANDISISTLAQKTDGYSHAELRELMENSKKNRWYRQPTLYSHIKCLYSKNNGMLFSTSISKTHLHKKKQDTTVTMKECLKTLKCIDRARFIKKWKGRWHWLHTSPLVQKVILPLVKAVAPRTESTIDRYTQLKDTFLED
jgi:hypothetical protein